MSTTSIVVIAVLIGGTFIGAGIAVFVAWKKQHIEWLPVPWYYAGARYVAPKGYDARYVSDALKKAEQSLIECTKWRADQLARVCSTVHVFVVGSEAWVDLAGRKVAGIQDGHILMVGRSLPALCHELAHLCEAELDKEVDDAHATWADDGIWNAIERYEGWIREQLKEKLA